MKTFTLSAHKFHSPDFREWAYRWGGRRGMIHDIQARHFGEVEITVGFENSDPEEVRECANEISWRDKDDFSLRAIYA
jgi:hypothetical protein